MSSEAPEQQRSRRLATSIRASKQQPQDQPAPPLLVDGPEAVRDPHC
jgi:hypothetical protein